MRIAVGIKAHSGWAALVAIGRAARGLEVVDRRRIELVEPADRSWAKQPYHAAENLPAAEAEQLVARGLRAARQAADKRMRALLQWAQDNAHRLEGCAVLVGSPLPEWTTEQILSVHMRMHKAEGWLFPTVLARAAAACNINVVTIREDELRSRAATSAHLAAAAPSMAALGKSVGPPWGKDQKIAALAAAWVLEG